MKRIKLFEAFNNTEKIDKVNFLTYCWALEKIISSHNSRIEFKSATCEWRWLEDGVMYV